MQNNSRNSQEIGLLLSKIQERLQSLESKIDALGLNLQSRTFETTSPAPVQKPAPTAPAKVERRDNRRKDRPMFKAICADCNKECEVPFHPVAGRPVYCRECYARRKNGNAPKPAVDSRPKDVTPAPPVITRIEWHDEIPAARKEPAGKKKPAVRQKPVKKAPRKQKKKTAR